MHKSRLEAFSDGVLAIILTIMVLELKVPHGTEWTDLTPLTPTILSYILSFIYIGIYWSNHHHLFQAAQQVNGAVLWANLHLLFWLSITPFVTAWAGENSFQSLPVACYGFILMMSGVAYYILTRALVTSHGKSSALVQAVGRGKNFKETFSVLIYLIAIPLAFWHAWVACAFYIVVAFIWIVPDRRISSALAHNEP